MSRVLIYTSPAKGHLTPVRTAAIELAGRGHTVHVRTLAGEVEGIQALGMEASAIDPRIEDREMDDWKANSTMAALEQRPASVCRPGTVRGRGPSVGHQHLLPRLAGH